MKKILVIVGLLLAFVSNVQAQEPADLIRQYWELVEKSYSLKDVGETYDEASAQKLQKLLYNPDHEYAVTRISQGHSDITHAIRRGGEYVKKP